MKALKQIQDDFAAVFAENWKHTHEELTKSGFIIGANVQNTDTKVFRLTSIKPKVYSFGRVTSADIVCYGVMLRADGTWGTHQHWVGELDKLTVL